MVYIVWLCIVCVVFFFKQKTAYEMRISDWSSDVCSSDLGEHQFAVAAMGDGGRIRFVGVDVHFQFELRIDPDHDIAKHGGAMVRIDLHVDPIVRSEEHTSELQSLMRISYAVFCLKKKKYTEHNTDIYRLPQPTATQYRT